MADMQGKEFHAERNISLFQYQDFKCLGSYLSLYFNLVKLSLILFEQQLWI